MLAVFGVARALICARALRALAVVVAFQHLLADGLLDHRDGLLINAFAVFSEGGIQGQDDGGIGPLIELLHEALWFILFGHTVSFPQRVILGG